MSEFSDDDIQRTGLPQDAFCILHDCAYFYVGCPDWYITNLVEQAQKALTIKNLAKGSKRL